MKTKIITTQKLPGNLILNKNLKNESTVETEKKIQMLTEKLANHFKTKLSNLITEKNYKLSSLILDIGAFVRILENSTYEIETVVPRLEKHITAILNKVPSSVGFRYDIVTDKIVSSNKTESIKINIDGDYYPEEYIKSLPNTSVANNNYNKINNSIRGIISPIKNNKDLNNLNYRSSNNILKENSVFASKSGKAKINSVSKTNSKKTLTNILSNHNNNNNNIKISKRNENLNKEANYQLSTLNINTESTGEYGNYNTIPGKSNSVAKAIYLNTNNDLIGSKEEKNIIKKTEKLNDLREKALDEWAMIAKYNHLKHLEDQENRRNFEDEKKRKVREILDNQMKEKDLLRKLKEEEDMKFFKMQAEKISNLEKDYNEKERKKIEKVKIQKEMQEKLIKEAQDLKNERIKTDKIKDKIILEKLRYDLITEDERLLAKRRSEREMYMNTIKENEVKAEMKKRQKELEKLENKKALDEYTNLIEKQEKERFKNLQNKIVKSNNDFELQDFKARKQEELQKQFEEHKFLKEKEELEIKKELHEDSLKYKKQAQIFEIKNILRSQIQEKKLIETRNKQEAEKFNEIIKSNAKKFVDEKEHQIKDYQSKVLEYKELLDHQLQEKGNRKYNMDEKERLLNKDLIGKIYSEYKE